MAAYSDDGDMSAPFRWDSSSWEIHTRSVERTLEPLVNEVTRLINERATEEMIKGRSRRAIVALQKVRAATDSFVERGKQIAEANPEMRNEMLTALDEVRRAGEQLYVAAQDFCDDPCSGAKRGTLVRAARALLSAVTRLLILADMADVNKLLRSLRVVEADLNALRRVRDQNELASQYASYDTDSKRLGQLACLREADLLDPFRRDEMRAARAVLKKQSVLLLVSSKALVRHPEVNAARLNRDSVCDELQDAVKSIRYSAAQRADEPQSLFASWYAPGGLGFALDTFERLLTELRDTANQKSEPGESERLRGIQAQLETVVSGAAQLANSWCTREDRAKRILYECEVLRGGLRDFLAARSSGQRNPIDQTYNAEKECLKRLRKQLWRAAIDHVSDTFVEQHAVVTLNVLSNAGQQRDIRAVEAASGAFLESARRLGDVAALCANLSSSSHAVQLVRVAIANLERSAPRCVNANRLLATAPSAQSAESEARFREAWFAAVRFLFDATANLLAIGEYLRVTEQHLDEDAQHVVGALSDHDVDALSAAASAAKSRCLRVCEAVNGELAAIEAQQAALTDPTAREQLAAYAARVREALGILSDQVIPLFDRQLATVSHQLETGNVDELEQNELVDATRLLYDAVRDIRRAILFGRGEDDSDSEDDDWRGRAGIVYPYEELLHHETVNRLSIGQLSMDDAYGDGSGFRGRSGSGVGDLKAEVGPTQEKRASAQDNMTEQAMMRRLPADQRAQITREIDLFRIEKQKLDREISKWDDSNDIVILAKQMCMIMMEMTDFTRGRGPLKSTPDLIEAARRISALGNRLNDKARPIGELCPDPSTRNDLSAYLQQIILYCHQLNITSKVKADVHYLAGQPSLAALDSVTSLIQAAKNLMASVVQTVKTSYVASTKIKQSGRGPVMQWKLRKPEKKPLVAPRSGEEQQMLAIAAASAKGRPSVIHRSSQPAPLDAAHELNQYDDPDAIAGTVKDERYV